MKEFNDDNKHLLKKDQWYLLKCPKTTSGYIIAQWDGAAFWTQTPTGLIPQQFIQGFYELDEMSRV